MNNFQRTLYNFKASKDFNNICKNISFINCAQLQAHTLKRTMLKISINKKSYAIMLYNRSYNDRYELGQIRDEKAKSQLFTNLIQHPDAIKSFYIEHNIKELEFLNFIQSLPLTFYNLKALYIKDLSLNRITHD